MKREEGMGKIVQGLVGHIQGVGVILRNGKPPRVLGETVSHNRCIFSKDDSMYCINFPHFPFYFAWLALCYIT